MSKQILLEALLNIWKIKKDTGANPFIKFMVTGGLGTITNLIIFFICTDMLNLSETPVSIGCFIIAATQNYILNHRWSFKKYTTGIPLSIKKWLVFISSSLLGLFINILVMKSILLHFTLSYKSIAQACGIAAGMVINFVLSKDIVFGSRQGEKNN